jgi:hypothetical protein
LAICEFWLSNSGLIFFVKSTPDDASFESQSPQLPPVFEYDSFKYIDTARFELELQNDST